jgi:SAM-dependent methyltransferase
MSLLMELSNSLTTERTLSHDIHVERTSALSLVSVGCCICEADDAAPVAVGEDFEYRTSPDTFLAMRCHGCGLVYLNPRPSLDELSRIYPQNYHAFDFNEERFGLVYKVRRRLEARRVLSWCRELGDDARIIDVGCGDGFHLRLLRDFGKPGWKLEGVDSDERAVMAATRDGLKVHQGTVEQLELAQASYDLALLIQTIEHVADPPAVLRAVRSLLKPGGTLVIVTDNTDSPDFRFFKGRHWGGYHFPRHWNLFNIDSLRALAGKVEMEVASLSTIVSPVNWVYSIRNTLVDWHKPRWLINRFSLESPGSLAAFTVFDSLHQLGGRGALLRAILRRPN